MIVGTLVAFLDPINFIMLTFIYSKKKERLLGHNVGSKMAVLVMFQIPLSWVLLRKRNLELFSEAFKSWPKAPDQLPAPLLLDRIPSLTPWLFKRLSCLPSHIPACNSISFCSLMLSSTNQDSPSVFQSTVLLSQWVALFNRFLLPLLYKVTWSF